MYADVDTAEDHDVMALWAIHESLLAVRFYRTLKGIEFYTAPLWVTLDMGVDHTAHFWI